ncbi:DUF5011 domain-containing protein [Evansella cellulosilytica]|uniref:Ig domain protein n=1 Tax=Evansella cellulosilytica (strain ATCC 21833 / DSM 2522 / FERM P-1141 / JCM 9156 / N-4) TaxID=649639 RepID=E6TUX4_EVAC2|nr:DUF5011 domain-containing protein [Evansella cellulosilytica]ADU32126.1 Ig domain protein [Evansella cellulosilytica DSM 2522]
MERRKFHKKSSPLFLIVILILSLFISGCTVAFRGVLNENEGFYLQSEDASATLTEVDAYSNILVSVDPLTTVGGFIASPVGEKTVYWVPRYLHSQDGFTYYDFFTEEGRPSTVPADAQFNGLIIDPMEPNRMLVSLRILDENNESVDGYTHVYVSETNSTNGIWFYDFDYVIGSVIAPLSEEEYRPSEGWRTADSTSTIFGYFNKVDHSFFDLFDESHSYFLEDLLNPLLHSLGENTTNPQAGVTEVFTYINDDVWDQGSFSLDLKSGEIDFTTVEIPLPQLSASLTAETGTVQLDWPEVFGEVSGYKIYQDDVEIAEVDPHTTTIDIANLTVGETYAFSVKGIVEKDDVLAETILTLSTSQFVADEEAPVFSLNGSNPMTLEVGSPYIEPGFTAIDNVDGDITNDVVVSGSVNIDEIGEYTLVYTVSDSAGNEAEATRVVHVVDTTAPVISLDGDNPLIIEKGSEFVEPGYTAVDNVDGDITDQVAVTGEVDTNTPGEYTLTYSVNDSEGNNAQITREVIVKETEIPPPPTEHPEEDGTEEDSTEEGGTEEDSTEGETTEEASDEKGSAEENTPEEDKAEEVKTEKDEALPNTSTNIYNMLFAGMLFALMGGITLIIRR